jgi:CheY-like chemotaxis protein
MDVQMPDMDGLEATQEIRRLECALGGHVPIYGVTAYAMTGDREVCLVAGMDGYIAKPVEFAALRSMVMGVAVQKNAGPDAQSS